MFEKLWSAIGYVLRRVRSDTRHLVMNQPELKAPFSIDLRSPDFEAGDRLPARCTADGACMSPTLTWMEVPNQTQSIAFMIEDADSPTPAPLVNAIAFNFAGRDGMLTEGMLPSAIDPDGWPTMGLSSRLAPTYLPPDPPPGHGRHRYVFEVFALDRELEFDAAPGRSAFLQAMRGHVIAKGCIVGTYERA